VEHPSSLCRQVYEGNPLFQVGPGGDEFSLEMQSPPECVMRLQTRCRRHLVLRQSVKLFRHLPRCRILTPAMIKSKQTLQRREELGRVAELLTQGARPCVGLPHFRGAMALDSHQDWSQSKLYLELLVGTFGRLWQLCEER